MISGQEHILGSKAEIVVRQVIVERRERPRDSGIFPLLPPTMESRSESQGWDTQLYTRLSSFSAKQTEDFCDVSGSLGVDQDI